MTDHPDRPLSTRRTFVARAGTFGLGTSWLASVLAVACRNQPKTLDSGDADLGPIEKNLNLYIWSDYLADDTVPNFEKEFGVSVAVDTYESNEELAAKLLAGASGYDLVLPSSYLFPVFFAKDLLAPVHRKYLSNWDNLAPLFLDPEWDPGNAHSVPWSWGVTGIAYRKDKVGVPPDSWSIFHDASLRGKMTMLDDIRDVLGSFLRLRGHSLNSVDQAELAQAKVDALLAKPNLKAYVSAAVKAQLIAGDVWIAQMWNGDAAQAIAEQPAIQFVVPKEGTMIFVDALVIPKSAPHKRAAHEFLNYVLRPSVAAAIADKTGYGTPNQLALALTKAKVQYPTADLLGRLEYQKDLGPAIETWDRLWTEIKSG